MTDTPSSKTDTKQSSPSGQGAPRSVWHFVCGLLSLAVMIALVLAISVPVAIYVDSPSAAMAELLSWSEWSVKELLNHAWRGVLFMAFVSLHLTLATIATIYGFRLIMLLGRWVSTGGSA